MIKQCVECEEAFKPGSEGEDMCMECWEHLESEDAMRDEEHRQLDEHEATEGDDES